MKTKVECNARRRGDAASILFRTRDQEDVVVFDRSAAGFRSARRAIDDALGEDYMFGNMFSEFNRAYSGDRVLFQSYIRWWDWSQRDVFLFRDGRLARIGTMAEKWFDGSSGMFNMNFFLINGVGSFEHDRYSLEDMILSRMLRDYMSGFPPEYDTDTLMACSMGEERRQEFRRMACSADVGSRIVAAASCDIRLDGGHDGGFENRRFIRALAGDPDWRVRRALAGNFWVDAGLAAPLLDDPDWRVRQALCRIDGDDYGGRAGLFKRLARDPEYEVRILAAAEIAANMSIDEYSMLVPDVLDSSYDDDFKADFAMMAVSSGH